MDLMLWFFLLGLILQGIKFRRTGMKTEKSPFFRSRKWNIKICFHSAGKMPISKQKTGAKYICAVNQRGWRMFL